MELTLTRTTRHKTCTAGRLAIDGTYFCDTLEPIWRDIAPGRPGRKIPGKTAIPEGRYPVAVTLSPGLGRWLPLLLHVPGFEGIRIHEGNIPGDTAGCILVGQARDVEGVGYGLIDSRLWLHRLMKTLGARPEGEAVWITVLKGF
ncbi:DUF5675 family protein [uncultured Parabacteroides sp.]|uniref:DUF5675 family protein n=1 Tax=uncultured Parabacteroides sp. TaxID=512312 RepID=UPI0025E7DB0F|nr:DUF5675 family protein [uncultured Parabacteroides sp.]